MRESLLKYQWHRLPFAYFVSDLFLEIPFNQNLNNNLQIRLCTIDVNPNERGKQQEAVVAMMVEFRNRYSLPRVLQHSLSPCPVDRPVHYACVAATAMLRQRLFNKLYLAAEELSQLILKGDVTTSTQNPHFPFK